jgi:CubicO group peptidase (beta-lactamase class C family)
VIIQHKFEFMFRQILIVALATLFTTGELPVAAQVSSLPRSMPEAEGVSSNDIIRFLDAAAKSKTEFHSFMLLRHGKVIAQGWWNPYRANEKHMLYSCSKSFTATAVGFAISEKKLSLNDKVISFFPNYLPDTLSDWLKELTVKDALMMSDGQEPDPSFIVASEDTNWIKGFLTTPIVHEPGTQFLYNSLGTYMLSAVVQKATGQKVIDYLQPRLFAPLGISGIDWETDLQGINTGGWGLRLKTEDMAKFAELFLQDGKWNGKQILSADWVHEASTMKIMQDPNAPQSKKDSSDWLQGYCYQMWRCRHNAFRGDGAFGQFMIVMPDQDAALAITAETPDMQEEINLVWDYLLPAFGKKKLPGNESAYAKLEAKIHSLALPVPVKHTEDVARINGKSFIAADNDLHLKSISFSFANNICHVTFEDDKSKYPIDFGAGQWIESSTSMRGPSLTYNAIENLSMVYPAKIAAIYTWKDATTLELILRYTESPHTETITCHLAGNQLSIEVARSFQYGKNNTILQAQAAN